MVSISVSGFFISIAETTASPSLRVIAFTPCVLLPVALIVSVKNLVQYPSWVAIRISSWFTSSISPTKIISSSSFVLIAIKPELFIFLNSPSEVSRIGRATQGVRIMKVADDEKSCSYYKN